LFTIRGRGKKKKEVNSHFREGEKKKESLKGASLKRRRLFPFYMGNLCRRGSIYVTIS